MNPEAPQPPKIGTGYSCPKCGNTGDQKCGHPEAALVPACSICRRTDHPLAGNGLCWECWSNHPELQKFVAAQPELEAAQPPKTARELVRDGHTIYDGGYRDTYDTSFVHDPKHCKKCAQPDPEAARPTCDEPMVFVNGAGWLRCNAPKGHKEQHSHTFPWDAAPSESVAPTIIEEIMTLPKIVAELKRICDPLIQAQDNCDLTYEYSSAMMFLESVSEVAQPTPPQVDPTAILDEHVQRYGIKMHWRNLGLKDGIISAMRAYAASEVARLTAENQRLTQELAPATTCMDRSCKICNAEVAHLASGEPQGETKS